MKNLQNSSSLGSNPRNVDKIKAHVPNFKKIEDEMKNEIPVKQNSSQIEVDTKKFEGRKPLHEPKTRIELPKREKVKIERWPVIAYPPIKRKPWDPEKIKTENVNLKPKIVIDYPPLKRRPWKPQETPKIKEKPVIQYPPLKLRSPMKKSTEPVKAPPQKRTRLEKTHFPIPLSTLDKAWNNFKLLPNHNFMILRGNFSVNHKKYGHNSNKTSSSNAVTCLIYTHLHDVSKWKASDIDKILDAGFELYKKSVISMKFVKNKNNFEEMRPNQVNSTIYIDLHKIKIKVTRIQFDHCEGSHFNSNAVNFENHMNEIFKEHENFILNIGYKSYAIWINQTAFYVFVQDDVDQNGMLTKKSHQCLTCVLRFKKLSHLIAFIQNIAMKIHGIDSIQFYSFQFLEKIEMNPHPERMLEDNSAQTDNFHEDIPLNDPCCNVQIELQPEIDEPVSFEEGISRNLIKITKFSKDFKRLTDNHGILRGLQFNQCPENASKLAISSILMLHRHPSQSWTTFTLNDIFTLAESIKSDKSPISFENHQYSIEIENKIFGQITSNASMFDLKYAVTEYLRCHDVGVIFGPRTIPFWQESGFYFMFDASECDEFGRKFIQNDQIYANHGSCCLTWFKNLDDLIGNYIQNVSESHLSDLFKIVKVHVTEFTPKCDWNSWTAIDDMKWIIRGRYDETHEKFDIENQGRQGLCMAMTAIAYRKILPLAQWNSKTIDKILDIGDEFHTITLLKLKSANKFISNFLQLDEISNQIKINDKIIHFNRSATIIHGSLTAVMSDDSTLTLIDALKQLFHTSITGIIISCDIALAVMKVKDHFYVFDSHPRNEKGERLNKNQYKGLACALRFTSIESMSHSLMKNFVIENSSEFNLIKIEASIDTEEEKPLDLKNYTKLLNYKFAGIQRAENDLHEDAIEFPINSPEKTYSNLVTCLTMNELYPAIHWNSKDISEILRLGYNLMLRTPSNEDYRSWIEGNCKIGCNRFKVTSEMEKFVFYVDDRHENKEMCEKISKLNSFNVNESASLDGIESVDDDDHEKFIEASSKELSITTTIEDKINSLVGLETARIIIESNIFSIALWKQGNLFFVFDPKPTLADGTFSDARIQFIDSLTRKARLKSKLRVMSQFQVNTSEDSKLEISQEELRRYGVPKVYLSLMNLPAKENRDEIQDQKTHGASVIVFSNKQILLKHLYKNIPERHKYSEFIWHFITINNEINFNSIENSSTWHHFTPIKTNNWILRGNKSLKHDESRQDSSNCVIALSFSTLIDPSKWNSSLIDATMKYGARLYTSSVQKNRKLRSVTLKSLEISEIIDEFVIAKTKFIIQFTRFDLETTKIEKNSHENGIEIQEKSNPFPCLANLDKYLSQFFNLNEFGVLKSKKYAVSVFKDNENAFYMFDPHSTGPNGVRSGFGVASLSRFLSIKDLCDVFLASIDQIDQGPNIFELFNVKIEHSPSNQSKLE